MIKAVAMIVIVIAAAALLRVFVIAPYADNRVEREIIVNTAAALRATSEAEASEIARRNLQTLRGPAGRRWAGAEVFVLMAANHRVLRDYGQAIAAYDRAIAIEPSPTLYLNRGVTELAAGRPEAAHESFDLAVRFDPRLAGEARDAEQTFHSLPVRTP